jgi:UDP-N-acetylmuramoylalanine--D-glutamate ligase
MLSLKDKKISVIGLARSGKALVRVLTALGAKVLVSDRQPLDKLQPALEELKEFKFELEAGGHSERIYRSTDIVVISPGVPINLPILKEAKAAGVPVYSEVELAYRICPAPIIAVTGTNGKSTTASLIYESLKAGGKNVILAGNIGIPLIAEIYQAKAEDWVVAEISSFQLEAVESFSPHIALFLNITLDHLDRHKDFEEYLETKCRIFANQTSADYAVLPADDPVLSARIKGLKAQTLYFSLHRSVGASAYQDSDDLVLDFGKPEIIFNLKELPLRGEHNLKNLLAAALAAHCAGVKVEAIRQGIKNFVPLHHRMELVEVIQGVSYVDDSKGTNPDSVIAALKSYQQPLLLLAGGKDKGMDFTALAQVIAQKVKFLILMGESAPKIAQAVKQFGFENIFFAPDLKTAVWQAYQNALPGEVVLLSPACASFDMFNSAEERGDIFKALVKGLKHEKES